MAQRINITIPDNLFNKLQKVKAGINVSKVCQEAIDSAIKIEEIKIKEKSGTNEAIKRLREERKVFAKKYYEKGYEDGYEHASYLSYPQLVSVVTFKIQQRDKFEVVTPLVEDIKKYQKDDIAFDFDAYLDGWHEGIKNFWEKYKDKIMAKV